MRFWADKSQPGTAPSTKSIPGDKTSEAARTAFIERVKIILDGPKAVSEDAKEFVRCIQSHELAEGVELNWQSWPKDHSTHRHPPPLWLHIAWLFINGGVCDISNEVKVDPLEWPDGVFVQLANTLKIADPGKINTALLNRILSGEMGLVAA